MTLVSTDWLNQNLNKVKIIDASWHLDKNRNALEVNEISKDRLYDTFLTNLITNSGASASMQDSGIMEILLQRLDFYHLRFCKILFF